MATLYDGKMAEIYDIMYQSFIDYDIEFEFYYQLLKKNNCNEVLEIGSGTGNLTTRFLQQKIKYTGLDYSKDMISIAQKKVPKAEIIHGDMRNFTLQKSIEAIIMTGRTSSYIISNNDMNSCLNSISKNLKKEGIFIFDFIDANRYIPYICQNKDIEHSAMVEEIKYSRVGNWEIADHENFTLNWSAQYYLEKDNIKSQIADDFSTVRVFTLDEIKLFLFINNFEILEIIDKKTYAYDTYVIIAKKVD